MAGPVYERNVFRCEYVWTAQKVTARCENVAVARKNFLFAGSEAGAERAALFFSLLESCRRLGINPHEYLTDVLSRLATHPASRIGELTPSSWKERRAANPVS